MENDGLKPESRPAGNRPPPRPPNRAAVGLDPDGDDSGKKRRATIAKAADGEGKFIRQSGGRGQYGHVIIRVEPNGRGKGIEITSDIHGDEIPVGYIPPAIDGVRLALEAGLVIGEPALEVYEVIDIVVRIVDGSFHQIDSSDLSFKMAGIFAIKHALKNADPVVIE